MNKTCSYCKASKDILEFALRKSSKQNGPRNSVCIPCMQEYGRNWYAKNKSRNLRRLRHNKEKRKNENIKFVREYLSFHPCVDCGETDLRVLDFDHVKGKKRDSVLKLAYNGLSLEVVKAEVSKCEVRCANDHRRRTYSGNVGKWRNGSLTSL